MINRRTVPAATGAAAASTALGTAAARGDATIGVNPSVNHVTWEGWGTSLAWWANVSGDRDDFADPFFTTKSATCNGVVMHGLGPNIARYNLGIQLERGERRARGGLAEHPAVQADRGVLAGLEQRGPELGGVELERRRRAARRPGRGHPARGDQRAVRQLADVVDVPEPQPSGAANAATTNPQPWNRRQHARHLAVTARRARDQWGVDFRTVNPFNEPSSNYWHANGTHEGCKIDAATQGLVRQVNDTSSDGTSQRWTLTDAADGAPVIQWNALNVDRLRQVVRIN